MRNRHNHWLRKAAALVCLLAVVLLQAPFARAAWMSSAMNCCLGDNCPIPGHHHKNANAENEMPMDCGHNTGKMSDCKISCCKTTGETAINIQQFVVPHFQSSLVPRSGTSEISLLVPQMISRSEKPLSPPPKLSFA
jgi:hypothetical protein